MYQKRINFFSLILILLGGLYFDLITEQKLVNPDAMHILGNLDNYSSPINYLGSLFKFKTIDFQPLRDISFYFDLFFFNQFDINTFVLQNVFWWIACCWIIFKILILRYSLKFSDFTLLFFVLAFSVYPLFFNVIAWGVARKHLMSFFFSLCGINLFIKKDILRIFDLLLLAVFYLLSILSQPISILLPFWFLLFNKLERDKCLFRTLKDIYPLFLIFGIATYFNYNYYKLSPTFNFIYNSKTSNGLNLADKLLAFGHYVHQVVFPYKFSFFYDLGDFRVLIGLGLFVLFMLFIYFIKLKRKIIFLWISLGLSSLVVILQTPQMLYDTYLLMFLFSFFMLTIDSIPSQNERIYKVISFILIIFWFFVSIKDSVYWKSRISFAKMSFDRTPHCRSALNYLKVSFEEDTPPSEELKKFNIDYLCTYDVNQTPSNSLNRIQLIANVFFYDDSYPADERINQLKAISKYALAGKINLAALHVKLGKEADANAVIYEIIKTINSSKVSPKQYNTVTSKYLYPYCQSKKWDDCLKVITPMSIKMNAPCL
jgi:hypothetical protein